MPISNPILTINVAEAPPPMAVLQARDPNIAPYAIGTFWLNTISDRLWVAKGTNSLTDWALVTADVTAPPPMAVLLPKDPDIAPYAIGTFWLNTISDRLFIAKATNSLTDWALVTADSGGADIATILGAIIVEDNAVVTDGKNVLYEIAP